MAVKVTALRPLEGSEKYKFAITLEGFIVNGFIYNPATGSIQMPSCNFSGKRVPLVKAFGIHIKRLRERLDAAIQESKSGIDI